jgi:hypothetical protein
MHTPKESEFLKYFRCINKHSIDTILSRYRTTGPVGYASSLMLARMLKVKERISSDRELSEKLAKIKIYRNAIGINSDEIPAHKVLLIFIDILSYRHISWAYLLHLSQICQKWFEAELFSLATQLFSKP